MATKTIAVTEDAYEELRALRLPNESFSQAIKRLAKAKGRLSDCFGLWKDLAKDEREDIEKAINAGRRSTTNVLGKLYG